MKRVGGTTGWARNLAAQRAAAKPRPEPAIRLAPAPRAELPDELAARLGAAGIPEKLAAEHGRALEGALADAGAVTAFVQGLEPWRARAIDRIVAQLYKSLGLALGQAPAEERAAVAVETVRAFRRLTETIGPADALGPAMNAALGLFELGLRHVAQKRLVVNAADRTQALAGAADEVIALQRALAGRPGTGTALNIFPVLVEQLERTHARLTPAERRAVWRDVAAFVADTAPKTGLAQEHGAELARALTAAIDERAPAPLARAAELFRAEHAHVRDELKAQLDAPIAQPAPGTPGRVALDRLVEALRVIAAAHPVAPDALRTALFNLYNGAVAELRVRPPAPPARPDIWPALAAMLEKAGTGPLAVPALVWAQTNLNVLAARPAAAQVLIAAAEQEGAALARALAEAAFLSSRQQHANLPALKPELDRLAELPADAALQAFFALATSLRAPNAAVTPQVVRHVVDRARTGGRDDMVGGLTELATNDAGFLASIQRYNLCAQAPANREKLALALASAAAGAVANANTAVMLLRSLEMNLPRVSLPDLIGGGTGEPGVWHLTNPTQRWRYPVQQIADQLLAAVQRSGVGRLEAEAQLEPARIALQLTAAIANLDGDYRIPLERVRVDLETALREPNRLKIAPRAQGAGDVRAFAARPSLAAFLRAHPELPPELAATAGVHLGAEQLAWVVDRCAKATGRDTKRALRDLVFACVTHNRLDLLDAVRSSEAPAKALSRTIAFAARSYREGKMGEVPFDAVIAGLRKNEDPIAAIDQARIAQTLAKLNLQELGAGGALDPDGMADIAKSAEALTYLFEYFKPGFNSDGIDHGPLRPIMVDVVKSVATGTWPSVKYENEAGKAQLAKLTPEQQAIWRSELVTASGAAGNQRELEEQREALQLARGLAKALERAAPPALPELELGWDGPSLQRVEARYAEQLQTLHGVEKGSPQHRELGKQIGRTRESLVLLRLHQAITTAPAEPRAALLGMRDVLGDAAGVLRRHGQPGAAEAATRIGFVARDLKSSPKQGTYACDEDNLPALITSCTGGCIHYTNVRRWALSSLAANANERILRVYEGDKFVYRAILKFFVADLGDYQGPVLWINQPNINGGGGNPEHLTLLVRHALLKAQAMGIPVVSRYADLNPAAKQMGLAVQQKSVTLLVEPGTTGLQYVDYLLRAQNGAAYAYDINKLRGNADHFAGRIDQCWIVKPR